MSFRCEFCGEAQEGGVAPIQVVTKIRHRGSEYEWKGTEVAEEKNSCVTCHDPEREPEILGTSPTLNAVGNTAFAKVA